MMKLVERPGEMERMTRRTRYAPALLLAVLALAACGGDDGDSASTSSSTSANATPAESVLSDAGLQICSQEEEQIAQSTVGFQFQAARVYAVANDCGGKTTSPNLIRVYQFGSRESLDQGAAALKKLYPNGEVLISGALVIVVTGPDKKANAAAVSKSYEQSTGEPVKPA
jgi:hypothetical protein